MSPAFLAVIISTRYRTTQISSAAVCLSLGQMLVQQNWPVHWPSVDDKTSIVFTARRIMQTRCILLPNTTNMVSGTEDSSTLNIKTAWRTRFNYSVTVQSHVLSTSFITVFNFHPRDASYSMGITVVMCLSVCTSVFCVRPSVCHKSVFYWNGQT